MIYTCYKCSHGPRTNKNQSNRKEFAKTRPGNRAVDSPAPPLDSIEKFESFAQDLYFHLSNAIKTTGTRPKNVKGKDAPWWTPECKAVYAEYRVAIDPMERRTAAKSSELQLLLPKRSL
ncbi:hypothetical protein K3495_g15912 [Podosphaera aphanis]|nr:hypothetical protein K3495_g15912 [Podosphaera aphanis]